MASMTGEEDHRRLPETAPSQPVGRGAPGGLDDKLLNVAQALHRIETAAAEHTDAGGGEISRGVDVGGHRCARVQRLHSAPAPMTRAVMDTDAGQLVIELFDADAPATVANFVKLAKVGF